MPDRKELLFVDFDGTLCHDRFWRSVDPNVYQAIQTYLFRDREELVRAWMLGKHTAEDIHRILAEELGIPYETLWQLFVEDCKTMRVDQDLLDRIARLRRSYLVILVTGNMDSFSRFTRDALQLDRYFDAIANSWDQKQLKDEEGGAVFTRYCASAGRSIQDAVLIDDSEAVCALFSGLGGTALRVTPAAGTRMHLDSLLKD